ncbi:MAG: hypothetical protein V3U57_09105 [Robiginitomaculum sp.]
MGIFRIEEDVFWSLAPHDVSMMLALFKEEPREIKLDGQSFITPGVKDEARLNMTFPSGGRAHIFVSWLHPFKEQRLVVVGERAMAVFEDTEADWNKKLAIYPHQVDMSSSEPVPIIAKPNYVSVPKIEPLKNECEEFLRAICKQTIPYTNAKEALKVLQVMEEVSRFT